MTDQFKILTQRRRESAHHETEVTIDWTGITERELYILARTALIHDLQARMVKQPGSMPEKVKIIAAAEVHHPSPALLKYTPPPPRPTQLVPKNPKRDSPANLADLLAKLTPDELKVLLADA